MGLATAPGIMQMVMRHITKLVTERYPQVKVQVYLDDFLFMYEDPDVLRLIPPLMQEWGFRINQRKPITTPTQRLTYLGIQVDLASRSLSVLLALQRQVLEAIQSAPLRSELYCQRMAGFVNFVRPIARLHYRWSR